MWADFPTGLQVAGVDEDECLVWNKISSTLIHDTLQFSSFFMADEGWFVCLSLMDQLPKIHKIGRKAGLLMHQVLSFMSSQVIYMRMESRYSCSTHSMLYIASRCQLKPFMLQVGTLAISMFYRDEEHTSFINN